MLIGILMIWVDLGTWENSAIIDNSGIKDF